MDERIKHNIFWDIRSINSVYIQRQNEEIQNMPNYAIVKELKSFLGSMAYYSKFIKNVHVKCVPLYEHLKKNINGNWKQIKRF